MSINANPNKSILGQYTPAITISYATPKGEDAVMKIEPKPNPVEEQEKLLTQLIDSGGIDNHAYRRLRKALKRAYRQHKLNNLPKGTSSEASKSLKAHSGLKMNATQLHRRSMSLQSRKEKLKKAKNIVKKSQETAPSKPQQSSPQAKLDGDEVPEVVLDDGTTFQCGCIAWAKIAGCPWWPCRVRTLAMTSDADGQVSYSANVSWFATKTFSVVNCDDLCPFLEDFHLRYTRKQKKSGYRTAVRNALSIAKLMTKNSDYLSLEV
jgi:hypothetical protein